MKEKKKDACDHRSSTKQAMAASRLVVGASSTRPAGPTPRRGDAIFRSMLGGSVIGCVTMCLNFEDHLLFSFNKEHIYLRQCHCGGCFVIMIEHGFVHPQTHAMLGTILKFIILILRKSQWIGYLQHLTGKSKLISTNNECKVI